MALTKLLGDEDDSISQAAIDGMTKLAEYGETLKLLWFHMTDSHLKLNIRRQFMRPSRKFFSFSKIVPQPPDVVVLTYYQNCLNKVRFCCSTLMPYWYQFEAEFRASIVEAIPQIVVLLQDDDWFTRDSVTNAFVKLSEQCEISVISL